MVQFLLERRAARHMRPERAAGAPQRCWQHFVSGHDFTAWGKNRVSSALCQGTTLHAAEELVARGRSGRAGLQASVQAVYSLFESALADGTRLTKQSFSAAFEGVPIRVGFSRRYKAGSAFLKHTLLWPLLMATLCLTPAWSSSKKPKTTEVQVPELL